MSEPIVRTELSGLTLVRRGKVRDVYEAGDGLLFVATDRLSAFDVVFAEGIPGKGAVLTALAAFWFTKLKSVLPNHFVTADPDGMPAEAREHARALHGRAMFVRRAQVLPVECIARGYLAGSGYKEYQRSGTVCGIPLPEGLGQSSKLPAPIFTPSTKAETGHDENIPFEEAERILGAGMAARVRDATLALYRAGAEHLAEKGILLCDTKFEFGLDEDGELMLVDEALTPDSSRFWAKETYAPGRAQDSFDKQIVRDYLLALGWDQKPPPPPLPREIIDKTAARYREIAERIMGRRMGEIA